MYEASNSSNLSPEKTPLLVPVSALDASRLGHDHDIVRYTDCFRAYRKNDHTEAAKCYLTYPFEKILHGCKGAKVLAMGCGSGQLCRRLIDLEIASQVHGVDRSEQKIAEALKQEKKKSRGITYSQSNATELTKVDEFDHVILTRYLINCLRKIPLIDDLAEVAFNNLRPGGRVSGIILNGDLSVWREAVNGSYTREGKFWHQVPPITIKDETLWSCQSANAKHGDHKDIFWYYNQTIEKIFLANGFIEFTWFKPAADPQVQKSRSGVEFYKSVVAPPKEMGFRAKKPTEIERKTTAKITKKYERLCSAEEKKQRKESRKMTMKENNFNNPLIEEQTKI